MLLKLLLSSSSITQDEASQLSILKYLYAWSQGTLEFSCYCIILTWIRSVTTSTPSEPAHPLACANRFHQSTFCELSDSSFDIETISSSLCTCSSSSSSTTNSPSFFLKCLTRFPSCASHVLIVQIISVHKYPISILTITSTKLKSCLVNPAKLKYAPESVVCTRLNCQVQIRNSVKLKYAPTSLPLCTRNGRQVLS